MAKNEIEKGSEERLREDKHTQYEHEWRRVEKGEIEKNMKK